ncbi:P-loop containing nucleoside triphosphate hydrolase protein [Karstenula rhodostoma CBS 690.94]|uniref:P-loop containing nucleoside triphosphate hydrolase protein n=1 Tax=Karstenula rhodostoma CBS 690.94 TaxID=1392251 RepID=A0A9P4PCG9_9PLEO|nr:P-loop containing nucleoside triphosphate hydrolase protein [Karstenula rhodostoma CBS 690.94]
MTGSYSSHGDEATREYFHHSSGQRVNTDIVLVEALRSQYRNLDLVIVPERGTSLLAYASAGHAAITPLEDTVKDPVYGGAIKWRQYIPPSRRLDPSPGLYVEHVVFGKYLYKWKEQELIVYVASGRDGTSSYPEITNQYVLTNDTDKVDELIKEVSLWAQELHNQVWVFDQGFWQKSYELWKSVQKSHWEDVILEEGMKKQIISDVENFFDGQETYQNLKVPWKRGVIYYGPPGNGKTISIKAMMHSLYQRGIDGNKKLSVPTLYVRTLSSFAGPEYSLQAIFNKAREVAPCYLVFEDLDSIVNDSVRSYFLNEVDGLKSNDGILMVGSTNHLDRLDPGISKRPSRFDRKYYFPDPDYDQRVQYAKYWQGKLKDNDTVKFPDDLCPAIAKITDKFSFAYMQEAFIASLLAIAARGKDDDDAQHVAYDDEMQALQRALAQTLGHSNLEDLVLWKEIQKQVKILREEMDEKAQAQNSAMPAPQAPPAPAQTLYQSSQAAGQGSDSIPRRQARSYQDELDAMIHDPLRVSAERLNEALRRFGI